MILRNRRISNISVKELLSRIDGCDIYKHYMPVGFEVGKPTLSPFRREKNPSFLVSYSKGECRHRDFADDKYVGNCIDFVMQLFNLRLNEAVEKIAADFGMSDTGKRYERVQGAGKDREETIIQVVPKEFTLAELKYWSDYHVDRSELIGEEVYSISSLYINKERIPCPKEMIFGYRYGEYWKVYKPLEKVNRWLSNVPITYLDGGFDKIYPKVIVTKSKKDKIIFKKFVPSCSVQNESLAAFSSQTILDLKKHGETYVAFDSDEAGVKSSWLATQKFGFKHVNVPYIYLLENIKDFSDLAKAHGLDAVENHLRLKNII